jgi:EAL domain-containing protein (putative c-di-GMP-specific phosphodiesterase class I)
MGGLREALARHLATHSDRPVRMQAGLVTSDDVTRGLEQREFALFYQPKIALATGRVCGAEALVRWRHPVLGLLSPAVFLDLVGEMGLMPRLTFDLLDQATAEVGRLLADGFDLRVSLNASQDTLADTAFSAWVLDACARHNVTPDRLIVEITETVAMTDVAHSLETLARLRMHGVGLAIDDFGTGHSSFQQLSRVPFTELKIDRGFVTGASAQPVLRTLVESSVRMAKDLGLTCTGEGIESREDWNLLQEAGCDAGQGFFIAGPMEPRQLPAWIRAWEQSRAESPSHSGTQA